MDDFLRPNLIVRPSTSRRTSTSTSSGSIQQASRSNVLRYSRHADRMRASRAKAKVAFIIFRILLFSALFTSFVALGVLLKRPIPTRFIQTHDPSAYSSIYRSDHPLDHVQIQHGRLRNANHQVSYELSQLLKDPRRSNSLIGGGISHELDVLLAELHRGDAYSDVHQSLYHYITDISCKGPACAVNHEMFSTSLSHAVRDTQKRHDKAKNVKTAIVTTGIAQDLFFNDTLARTPLGHTCHLFRSIFDCGLPYLERAHAVVSLLEEYLSQELIWYKSLEASSRSWTKADPFQKRMPRVAPIKIKTESKPEPAGQRKEERKRDGTWEAKWGEMKQWLFS